MLTGCGGSAASPDVVIVDAGDEADASELIDANRNDTLTRDAATSDGTQPGDANVDSSAAFDASADIAPIDDGSSAGDVMPESASEASIPTDASDGSADAAASDGPTDAPIDSSAKCFPNSMTCCVGAAIPCCCYQSPPGEWGQVCTNPSNPSATCEQTSPTCVTPGPNGACPI